MSIDPDPGHIRNSWRAAKKNWGAQRSEARQPCSLPRDRIVVRQFCLRCAGTILVCPGQLRKPILATSTQRREGWAMKRILVAIGLALAAATLASLAKAAGNAVTIGDQTTIEPAKLAIADGLYEKATSWEARNGPATLTKPPVLANSG
jgi:hypothetical protein